MMLLLKVVVVNVSPKRLCVSRPPNYFPPNSNQPSPTVHKSRLSQSSGLCSGFALDSGLQISIASTNLCTYRLVFRSVGQSFTTVTSYLRSLLPSFDSTQVCMGRGDPFQPTPNNGSTSSPVRMAGGHLGDLRSPDP